MSDKHDREERAERIMEEMSKGGASDADRQWLNGWMKTRRKIWTGVDLPNGLKRARIKLGIKEKLGR